MYLLTTSRAVAEPCL